MKTEIGSWKLEVRVKGAALLLSILTGFIGASALWAEEARQELKKEEEGKVEYKEVTGTVSAVSKQGIAVEYSRTLEGSFEVFLPLGDKVKLERLNSLAELKPGDTVKVRYEQILKETKEGSPRVLKTTATEVALMRRAPEEGALISKEEGSE